MASENPRRPVSLSRRFQAGMTPDALTNFVDRGNRWRSRPGAASSPANAPSLNGFKPDPLRPGLSTDKTWGEFFKGNSSEGVGYEQYQVPDATVSPAMQAATDYQKARTDFAGAPSTPAPVGTTRTDILGTMTPKADDHYQAVINSALGYHRANGLAIPAPNATAPAQSGDFIKSKYGIASVASASDGDQRASNIEMASKYKDKLAALSNPIQS